MRVFVLLACCAIAIVLATVSTSRGDGESSESASASDEPITGTPVEPSGSGEPVIESLVYDIGPPEAAWSYEQLSGAEKAVADRGLDEDQTAVQSGYAAATAALAEQATADRAALQLGVDEALEETGVVP